MRDLNSLKRHLNQLKEELSWEEERLYEHRIDLLKAKEAGKFDEVSRITTDITLATEYKESLEVGVNEISKRIKVAEIKTI